ncbi:unnamed protein product [Urochloa decumbens]|uniref:PH domain-containing protein n=1 Tax=Urochloa decumbens TaxID=240449 RepID=A0ABC9E9E8_9POAL
MFGFFGRNPQGRPPTFKIFCKADEASCLAVRGDTLVLAAADSSDERQHWIKDVRLSMHIKDKEGNPVFSLVNKATGLAIQHPHAPSYPVRLARFRPDDFDPSVLWTESGDLGKDFGSIRMMHNIRLNLDAVRGGTALMLSDGDKSDSQSWKMTSWRGGLRFGWRIEAEPTFRICCKAERDFSVTVRDGTVCLAPTSNYDGYQHWIYDTRPGEMFKDVDGYPAFALVNRVTGEAITGSAGLSFPLKLKPYNPNYLDESVLWTTGFDMGRGFRCIHMMDKLSLNFAFLGTSIKLCHWQTGGDNLLWKFIRW